VPLSCSHTLHPHYSSFSSHKYCIVAASLHQPIQITYRCCSKQKKTYHMYFYVISSTSMNLYVDMCDNFKGLYRLLKPFYHTELESHVTAVSSTTWDVVSQLAYCSPLVADAFIMLNNLIILRGNTFTCWRILFIELTELYTLII